MALKNLPSGDLLANARCTTGGSGAAGGMARFDGTGWSGVGIGTAELSVERE